MWYRAHKGNYIDGNASEIIFVNVFCVSGILLKVNMYISLYEALLVVSLYIEHLLNTSTIYKTLTNGFTNGD